MYIVNKARALLQRNINSCPMSVKDACYKTMIRPIAEYAATIWCPHTQTSIYNLGLGLLCFLNCLLCFGAMIQYSSYYAQIMLHKLTLCSKK